MSSEQPSVQARSQWARQMARLSVLAAFLSCSLNCVFGQVAARTAAGWGQAGWIVDWSSLAVVLLGIGLGGASLAVSLPRRWTDTAMIASIGLVLNLGIVFVIVWYFAVVRPETMRGVLRSGNPKDLTVDAGADENRTRREQSLLPPTIAHLDLPLLEPTGAVV